MKILTYKNLCLKTDVEDLGDYTEQELELMKEYVKEELGEVLTYKMIEIEEL